jgi:DNA primase
MPTTEQRRLLEEATMTYMENLPLALAYLAGRGITEEAARHAALGVAVEPLKGHEGRAGRLSIPYLTDAGPVNMTFRCIQDHDCKAIPGHTKYMLPSGAATNLYNVQAYEGAGAHISLCEGELDALVLSMLGEPAMGIPGADKWQPHWGDILQDFSRVYVFSDGDTAGQKFFDHVKMECSQAINIPMPDGHDVNSAYLAYGEDFLLRKIRS